MYILLQTKIQITKTVKKPKTGFKKYTKKEICVLFHISLILQIWG